MNAFVSEAVMHPAFRWAVAQAGCFSTGLAAPAAATITPSTTQLGVNRRLAVIVVSPERLPADGGRFGMQLFQHGRRRSDSADLAAAAARDTPPREPSGT